MQGPTVISDAFVYRLKWPFFFKLCLVQQDTKDSMQEWLSDIPCVMKEARVDNYNGFTWP